MNPSRTIRPLAACAVFALAALSPTASLDAQCATLGPYVKRGSLPTGLQPTGTGEEISGLAASRKTPNILWAHDDRGNGNYLIAMRTDGTLAQQYQITNASNYDWEDIAIGAGPVPGLPYIYIGDFGDNSGTRTDSVLWRIPEPDVPASAGATIALSTAVGFRFKFPGGSRNAEALFIDPFDGTPYVLTKETGNNGLLFRYPMPLDATTTKTLVFDARFSGAKPSFSAADITPDGRRIFARTKDIIYWWRRSHGQKISAVFNSTPCAVFAAGQGNAEALAVSADSLSLFMTSEGRGSPLLESDLILAPLGPTKIPTAFAFGTGWRALFTTPQLAASAPILGKSRLQFWSYGSTPSSAAILLISPTKLDDGKVKLGNGWLHALPDIVLPTTTDGFGRTSLDFGIIPNASGFRGLALHAQLVAPDFTPGGWALTRGLTVHFDR